MNRRIGFSFLVGALGLCVACLTADGQDLEVADDAKDVAAVLGVAESALAAISAEDVIVLTDLMVDEAQMFPTFERQGVAGYAMRTRVNQREQPFSQEIVERGWNAEVKVAGTVAMVWLPYDIYVDGKWSHCGVDVFTMVRVAEEWKIASMAWSSQQPPACEAHPDGPPVVESKKR